METKSRWHNAKLLKVFLVFVLAFTLIPLSSKTEVHAEEQSEEQAVEQEEELQLEDGTYDESHVVVKFKDSVESETVTGVLQDVDSVKSKAEGEVEEISENMATVKVEDGKTVAEAIADLKDDSRVEYAEPDYMCSFTDEVEEVGEIQKTNVNDPKLSSQWHMTDSNAKVQEAWDVAKCNKNVTVAVIDTGIDRDHPDLKNNIAGGYSVASSNTSDYEDKQGHGTWVAGVIAAQANNGVGVAGVSYNAKILPVKLSDTGTFTDSVAVKAINWVVQNKSKYNVKVINLSLGVNYGKVSAAMVEAVNNAWTNGILCVAASGNDGYTNKISCPASASTTLSVGAIESNHSRASYSNAGKELDVVAPGSKIFTTTLNGGYGSTYKKGYSEYWITGTSFSAPFAAATAALCFAANSKATPATVKKWIKSTAKDLGDSGRDDYYGHGQVVVKDAVSKAKSSTSYGLQRIYGNDCFGTNLATLQADVKENGLPAGVIVCTNAHYIDTLSASGLSGYMDYPIMLVNGTSSSMNATAKKAFDVVTNSGKKKIHFIVMGGSGAVSNGIYSQLSQRASKIERISGSDGYQTNMAAYNYGYYYWNTNDVIIATGSGYHDALGAGSYAAATKTPILLANPNPKADNWSLMYKARNHSRATILGGTAAVTSATEKTLKQYVKTVTRYSGADAYATNMSFINNHALKNGMTLEGAGFSTGRDFYDALGSAHILGKTNSVMFLVDKTESRNTTAYNKLKAASGLTTGRIFGGTGAVSATTANNITKNSK